jgi:hypothetical protein
MDHALILPRQQKLQIVLHSAIDGLVEAQRQRVRRGPVNGDASRQLRGQNIRFRSGGKVSLSGLAFSDRDQRAA